MPFIKHADLAPICPAASQMRMLSLPLEATLQDGAISGVIWCFKLVHMTLHCWSVCDFMLGWVYVEVGRSKE